MRLMTMDCYVVLDSSNRMDRMHFVLAGVSSRLPNIRCSNCNYAANVFSSIVCSAGIFKTILLPIYCMKFRSLSTTETKEPW